MRLDELEVFRIEVAPPTQHRHLERVSAAIRQNPPQRSRRGLTVVLAAALLLFPLAALASESALPGEFLHPIKRVFEVPRLLIDPDVRARHRVEELEILIERQSARSLLEQQMSEAEAAVGDRPLLRERLDRAREILSRGPVTDESRAPTTTTSTTAGDRPATVETTTRSTPPDTTTTVPPDPPLRTTTTAATRESTRP